jgi:hypothetical protein
VTPLQALYKEEMQLSQIEKVGLTDFLNLFRTVVSYSHLAIVIGFRLVVVNSRMRAVCENLGMSNVIRNQTSLNFFARSLMIVR